MQFALGKEAVDRVAQSSPWPVFGDARTRPDGEPHAQAAVRSADVVQIDSNSIEAAGQKLKQSIAPLFKHEDSEDMAQSHARPLGHLIGFKTAV